MLPSVPTPITISSKDLSREVSGRSSVFMAFIVNVTGRRGIECLKLITSGPILQSSLSNSNIYSLSSGWVVGTQTVLDRAAKSLSKLSCLKRFYLEISVTFCGYDAPDV